ncbi:hypothetical protein CKO28_13755 [Rhodovibrio sodomensis]|uniref:Uncharacterized protein n=1 Tax=Rhodovibrio sodomensis TaxID=1088 RepID=A0ABS1DF50_9PROT|nr:hypothetical protein [Rhodovibrio sodomensis]MBK1669099.1 hypothetical protein [Rhodovibrio sodomensis]
MKEFDAYSHTGEPIVGTLDSVTGTAEIIGFTQDGPGSEMVPDHGGGTDMHWDNQKTVTDGAGNPLYLDRAGELWRLDQLIFRESGLPFWADDESDMQEVDAEPARPQTPEHPDLRAKAQALLDALYARYPDGLPDGLDDPGRELLEVLDAGRGEPWPGN